LSSVASRPMFTETFAGALPSLGGCAGILTSGAVGGADGAVGAGVVVSGAEGGAAGGAGILASGAAAGAEGATGAGIVVSGAMGASAGGMAFGSLTGGPSLFLHPEKAIAIAITKMHPTRLKLVFIRICPLFSLTIFTSVYG
jgi:hypothetical protein